jgi:hypothetical protein
VKILSNGREIFQRREKNQRQRGSAKRPTLGDQSRDRTRNSLRATGDTLRMRKLTRFAKRTNEGQAGLLAGLEGERDAEIDLGPMPGLRKIRTAEGRVLARGLALKSLRG